MQNKKESVITAAAQSHQEIWTEIRKLLKPTKKEKQQAAALKR